MPRNIRIRVIFVVAIAALFVGGLAYWKKGAEPRSWQDVILERDRIARFRVLPGLDSYLERELGNWRLRTTYGHLGGDFSENERIVEGSLVDDQGLGGKFRVSLAYQDLGTYPTAITAAFTISPVLLSNTVPGEFRSLINRTREAGELRTIYGGMEWFSYLEESGNMKLTFRTRLPNPFLRDQPRPESRAAEVFYRRLTTTVSGYLRREALDEGKYTQVEWSLPFIDVPGSSRDPNIGHFNGFLLTKDGEAVPMRVTVSGSGGGDYDVHIWIRPDGSWKVNHATVKALFKQEFLRKSGVDAPFSIESSFHENGYEIRIVGKLRGFDEWRVPEAER